MSVLDTFFTLFKSSGVEDVEKDNDRAKKSNDKLDESLKGSRKTSDDLTRSFKSMGSELIGLATAGLSVASILSKLKSSVSYTIDLAQVSRVLNVNISDLDAWGNAVKKTGGTVQTFESSLQNLAMHLGTTGDVALKVLPQFADSFQKLGRYGSMKYGAMLGMDESLILLLQKGRREVESVIKQQKELGVVTQHDAEVALKFNSAWTNTTQTFRTLFAETATDILPLLTTLLSAFTETGSYLQGHREAIAGALMAIGGAALYAARGFFTLRRAMLALIPLAGIVYEDLKAFSQGKDSFIGEQAAKHKLVFKEVRAFVQAAHDTKKLFNKGNELFWNLINKKPGAPANSLPIPVKPESLTVNPDELQNLLPKAKAALGITTSVSLPSPNGLASVKPLPSKHISISIGDINIQTQTSDVQSMIKAIDDSFKEQLRQVLYNFDNGVLI